MLFLRRLLLRKQLRKDAKANDVYTIYSIYNTTMSILFTASTIPLAPQ